MLGKVFLTWIRISGSTNISSNFLAVFSRPALWIFPVRDVRMLNIQLIFLGVLISHFTHHLSLIQTCLFWTCPGSVDT